MRSLSRQSLISIAFSLLIITSVVVSGISFATGVAAADANVMSIEVVNTTDGDNDGKFSNFEVKIEADTRVSEFGYGITRGEPRVRLTVGDWNKTLPSDREANWEYTTGTETTWSIDGTEIADEQKNIEINVKLFDDDFFGDDLRYSKTKTVDYEPATKDFTNKELAKRGVGSLHGSYKDYKTEMFNAEFWRKSSVENIKRTVQAANPVPTTKRGAAIEATTKIAKQAAPGAQIWTATQVSVWGGISYYEAKMAGVLTAANEYGEASYGEGSYTTFRDDLNNLYKNTKKIRNASTDRKLYELMSDREKILRDFYYTELRYRYSVKSNVRDNYGYINPDEEDYDLFKSEFEELENHLIADYYWTQMYLDPDADTFTNLTKAIDEPPLLSPNPAITSVSYPDSIEAGNPVNITVKVTNNGIDAPLQSIAISFPAAKSTRDIHLKKTQFSNQSYGQVYAIGEEVGSRYGHNTTTLSYPLAEVGGEWKSGKTKSMTVQLTPQDPGEYPIYIKSVAQNGGWAAAPDIGSDTTRDQQSENVDVHKLIVTDSGQAPTAIFTGPSKQVRPGNQVTFDASNSIDKDGKIVEYAWDFDGNGVIDQRTTSPTVTHTFTDSGTQSVSLTVYDNDGYNSTTTRAVMVNEKPTVSFSHTPEKSQVGSPVTFDARNSADPDGHINNYEWDFDGDGVIESTNETPTYTYGTKGIHQATLKVTDNDNTSNKTTQTVIVGPELPGNGTSNDPYEITEATDLNEIKYDLSGNYILKEDIDAASLGSEINENNVFPIGWNDNDPSMFNGSLNGNGNTINDLSITSPKDTAGAGLFYKIGRGVVKNINIENIDINSERGAGSIAIRNLGIIKDVSVTGNINGSQNVGGIVGSNGLSKPKNIVIPGIIVNSTINGEITGSKNVGGVAGFSSEFSNVSNSRVSGSVTGHKSVGGAIGRNAGKVSNTSSAAPTTGNDSVGGLVGSNCCPDYWTRDVVNIVNSTATGTVTGNTSVGGLVGHNQRYNIEDSNSRGAVTGNTSVGGLVGHNIRGDVMNTTATGAVSGSNYVGGLIGHNDATNVVDSKAAVTNSTATGVVTGNSNVGGLIGYNDADAPSLTAPVNDSTAKGDVRASSPDGTIVKHVGGLVGDSSGKIRNSVAKGNVDVVGPGENIGGLVGYAGENIKNSTARGEVTMTNSGQIVGGLAGEVGSEVAVHQSVARGNVSAGSSLWVGGLAGYTRSQSIIKKSAAFGDVNVSPGEVNIPGYDGVAQVTGGLVARNTGSINQTYARGNINSPYRTGGLVGNNLGTISNSYATGMVNGKSLLGGLVGAGDNPVSDSYWNTETTDLSHSEGGVGLSTPQMTGEFARTNMSGLTFGSVWETQPNSYPTLTWQTSSENDEIKNTAPITLFSYQPAAPSTGTTVTFDASSSVDPDGSIISYEWDLDGNGAVDASGKTVSYTYDTAGEYDANLMVTDNSGATNMTSKTISVSKSEELSISNALDSDNNGKIGDFEILKAIEYWRTEEAVPQTGGKTIGDFKILALIEKWRTGSRI